MASSARGALVALLAGALLLSATGCFTTASMEREKRSPGTLPPGSLLDVVIHFTPSDEPYGRSVEWSLMRRDTESLVHRSDVSSWSSEPLAPGKYLLEIRSWERRDGTRYAPERPIRRTITLKEGEQARANVILHDYRAGAYTAMGVGIAGVATWFLYTLLFSWAR